MIANDNLIPINKPIFFLCFVASNYKFWHMYPERIRNMERLWDLFFIKYGINGRTLDLDKLNRYKNTYFDLLKVDESWIKQELTDLYFLGTNYSSGNFMEDTAVFNIVFTNFLNKIEEVVENKKYTFHIKEINQDEFYRKYIAILEQNTSLNIVKKTLITFEDIVMTIFTVAPKYKSSKFSNYMMENQHNFKAPGFLTHVKEFFGADQSKTRLDVMSFERLAVERSVKLPHCVIFISGFTSEGSDANEAWSGFTQPSDVCNFQAYNWDASTAFGVSLNAIESARTAALTLSPGLLLHDKNPFISIRQHAKVYGELLAHIIYTNSLFYCQNISLVGFSLVNTFLIF